MILRLTFRRGFRDAGQPCAKAYCVSHVQTSLRGRSHYITWATGKVSEYRYKRKKVMIKCGTSVQLEKTSLLSVIWFRKWERWRGGLKNVRSRKINVGCGEGRVWAGHCAIFGCGVLIGVTRWPCSVKVWHWCPACYWVLVLLNVDEEKKLHQFLTRRILCFNHTTLKTATRKYNTR